MLNPVVHAFDQLFVQHINYSNEDSAAVKKHVDSFIHELHLLSYSETHLPWLNRDRHLIISSFGRGTHINPLRDVRLLICLNGENSRIKARGEGSSYSILINEGADRFGAMVNADRALDSRAIANNFACEFERLPDANNVSVSPEGGATYRRKGCLWVFNAIPSFFIKHPTSGDTFYLIPDHQGNWRPIYPHAETATIQAMNHEHNGFMFALIHMMKYWNREHDMPKIPSPLLEALVVHYCEAKAEKLTEFADLDISGLLRSIREKIQNPVMDPIGQRGDLNTLSVEARQKVIDQAFKDQLKAESARQFELKRNYKRSIAKWAEVVGHEFNKLAQVN